MMPRSSNLRTPRLSRRADGQGSRVPPGLGSWVLGGLGLGPGSTRALRFEGAENPRFRGAGFRDSTPDSSPKTQDPGPKTQDPRRHFPVLPLSLSLPPQSADRAAPAAVAYRGSHDAAWISGHGRTHRPRRAVAGAGRARWQRRRLVRLRGDFDRHLLPAELPQPPPTRGPRALLRHRRRCAAGRLPPLQALQARHRRCRRARHGGRASRVGVSLRPRRPAGDAGQPRARRLDEPASPAATLQGPGRRLTPRVPGRVPGRSPARQPSSRRRCDDGDL